MDRIERQARRRRWNRTSNRSGTRVAHLRSEAGPPTRQQGETMSLSRDDARERMLHAILSRAATDPIFRSGLLNDPKQAISNTFGVAVPDHFRLRFIEKDPSLDALVVLPDLRNEVAELSQGDLDTVNGGVGGFFDGDEPW
jgi:hypothetical protein